MRKAYSVSKMKFKQYQTVLIETGFILQIQWNPTLEPHSYSFPSYTQGTLLWSGARFSNAPESFRAGKAIFRSSVSKNGEMYTPETSCMKETSLHL